MKRTECLGCRATINTDEDGEPIDITAGAIMTFWGEVRALICLDCAGQLDEVMPVLVRRAQMLQAELHRN